MEREEIRIEEEKWMVRSNEAERERKREKDKKVCDGRNKSTNVNLRLSFYYPLSSERFVCRNMVLYQRNDYLY